MKTHFLSILVCFAMMISSCNPNSSDEPVVPETPEEPETPEVPVVTGDTVAVSFNLGGEINISEEPLTRSSMNDLYGFNVYQSMTPINIPDDVQKTSITPYAYGYFDDLSSIMLKLAKNRYYFFEMVYIPDGKNKVHQFEDGHYGNPFECIFDESPKNGALNEVMYSNKRNISMMNYGATQAKGIKDYMIQSNHFNNIERYQGVLYNFHATDNNKTVNVSLYRMMVGIKLIIDDFTKGTVTVSSTCGKKHSVSPASNSNTNTLDIVVELLDMPIVGTLFNGTDVGAMNKPIEEFTEIVNSEKPFYDVWPGALFITYRDENSDEITLYANQLFKYKRLTKHVLQFSVSDAIANGGIQPNIKDDIDGDLTEESWSWN